MLSFEYEAKDPATNKHIRSTVQADSERGAAKVLMGQGYLPLSITETGKRGYNPLSILKNRVSTRDKVILSRQLATLVNAGLPLAQSLNTVANQTENKKLASVMRDVIASIEGGSTLSDAFAKHPEVFNDVYVALVSAGEASGTLDKALERIADQQEKDAEMLSKVRGAMVYPIIVLFVIVVVVAFLLLTVVPQIQILYEDLNQQLPFITMIMVGAATFVKTFWWLILILTGIGVYFLKRYIATDAGRKQFDLLKISIPTFGLMFKKLYMARFARTAQTLMSTGVPVLETLRISAQSTNNVIVGEAIMRAAEKVKGGKPLSESLKAEDTVVLPLVAQMIGVGEKSGSIDQMMGKAASFYENDLDNTIRSISTAIEPVLMVFLAVIAGGMVAAILIPIYGLVNTGTLR